MSDYLDTVGKREGVAQTVNALADVGLGPRYHPLTPFANRVNRPISQVKTLRDLGVVGRARAIGFADRSRNLAVGLAGILFLPDEPRWKSSTSYGGVCPAPEFQHEERKINPRG